MPRDVIAPDELRSLLHERRAQALARLAGTGAERAAVVEAARESVTDDEHDPEGATIAYERRLLEVLGAEAAERLVAVDRALARVGRGEHQVCERCGGWIPADRLRALPAATTCVTCRV